MTKPGDSPDEVLRFRDESGGALTEDPWKILVVDDDPEVHAVTRLALGDARFEDRGIDLVEARSAQEARVLLEEHSDIAMILLDVVMESDQAGLDLLREIRERPQHAATRIVLRTGQPGQAPPRDVVLTYDIDDYCTKTDLTYERLYIVVLTSLRSYALLCRLEQRNQDLSDSNRELERFAYVASHDLQTPLRGIVSFAQLLMRRAGATMAEDHRSLLEEIIRSGQHLHVLTNDLLEYSRLNQAELVLEPVVLDRVLNEVMDTLGSVISGRGAKVKIGPLPEVYGNQTQLEQLFRNLIDNGLKYQPGDNPVVEISCAKEGGMQVIRVMDHGIGVDPQYLENIFEMFRRLHTMDQYPGTGLGLAICRKIMSLHQGAIHAESSPGGGTTIVLKFPQTPKSRPT